MKHSDSLANIAPALVKVQGEMKAIAKDSVNPHFKNRYASLDVLTDTVRPILARNGLALMQGGGDAVGGAVPVETMLLHTSGEWISTTFWMPMEKATAQGAGSATTYGRRYGLASVMALTTDEDDDGQAAAQQPQRTSKPAPKPATPNNPPRPSTPMATTEQLGELKAMAANESLPANYRTRLTEMVKAPLTAAKAETTIKAVTQTLAEMAA